MIIGPSFSSELEAAGVLGLQFSWGTDGVIEYGPTVTPEQIEIVEAVKRAHDPKTSAPPLRKIGDRKVLDDFLIELTADNDPKLRRLAELLRKVI